MRLELRGRIPRVPGAPAFVARVTRDRYSPPGERAAEVLIAGDGPADPAGFRGVLRAGEARAGEVPLPGALSHLQTGDIVRIAPGEGEITVLYRRASPHNVLFLTRRCNSRCLMCPEPPVEKEDGRLVDDVLEAIPLMWPGTRELGITGGEPTLVGARLFEVIAAGRERLPFTALHLLSNGRRFRDAAFAGALAGAGHPDLMVGVPLYSDVAWRHDFVVQARGAFDEAVRGLLNLSALGLRVEIRVVLHRLTVDRLPGLARFISRNLPFVSQVALMGTEWVGFARANAGALWIDPADYTDRLAAAVGEFDASGIRVLIFGEPLCLLPEVLHRHAVRAISDWKNVYLPECAPCALRDACGGFFASSGRRHSRAIRPVPEPADAGSESAT